ncbi:sugar-binding transcriptional regulator [Serinicoccus chungangensis]|uniref:sugar-binding transcriptional regulator n=1 Tax=Serinicoccus chungangensis TaxID=767452 RepID=UPI00111A3776|nr:sugar-binding domain-containing protein [Serinicoccus chungangensis]
MSKDAQEIAASDRILMAQVARLSYLEDRPHTEIGRELGISRFKVARYLARARDEGVVTITINDVGLPDPGLAARLAEALGLKECVVIRSHGGQDDVRQQVGAAAAELLSTTVREGEVLGMTWGRTLTSTTSQLIRLPRVTVVQLTGFVSGDLGASPIEIVRHTAQRVGGSVRPIFSPLFVQDADTAETLKHHPDIAMAMDLFPAVTTAILSVGSWDPPITQVREVLPPQDVERFVELGCVADIAGILVRADGGLVDPEFQKRCVSISFDQLTAVPRVIGIAGGSEKADAIRAVVRGGLITSAVVDHELAEAALAAVDG